MLLLVVMVVILKRVVREFGYECFWNHAKHEFVEEFRVFENVLFR